MIPYGAIAAIAIWAVRQSQAQNGNQRPANPKDRSDPHWNWLVWLVVAPAFSLHLMILFFGSHVRFTPNDLLLVPEALLLFPWWIATRILAPLGLVHAAWAVGMLSDWVWSEDHRGGAAIAAAKALLARRKFDAEAAAWIERRINKGRVLKAGGVVACGLMAAARGDDEQARLLLASVEALDPTVSGRVAAKLAAEWRAADAAARGEWKLVEELGRQLGPRTRLTRFLGEVATRLRAESWPPSDRRLVWKWLLAPRRRATLPLLRRALAVPATMLEPSAPRGVDLAPREDRLEGALARHAATLAAARPTDDDLRRLGASWDGVFEDDRTRRHADERSLALGASGGPRALDKLRLSVEDDVVQLATAARLPIGELAEESAVLEGAARRLRDQLLGEVEVASEAVGVRAADRRELPATDEWREYVGLRALHDRAAHLGGLPLRRLAFPKLHTDLCKLAVWLWNERREKAIANAIFRFLLAEATAVDDARAVELQEENVKCGSGV